MGIKSKVSLVFGLILGGFLTIQAQIHKADSLLELGDYKNAIVAYSAAPVTAATQFKLARAYTATGNTVKAIDLYEQGLELEPNATKPRFELGKLYLNNNQWVESVILFQKLNQEFPDNATYLFYKGQSLERLNASDRALDVYENVLQLDPDYRNARMDLVALLIKKRETALAIEYAQQALDRNPDDIKFNSLIAQAYFYNKDFKEVIKHLEHLFELGNDTEFNRRTLGMSYLEDRQWAKAVENFDIFLKQYDDKDAAIYFMKSQAHLKLQEYEKAQDAIEYTIMFRRPALHQEYLQLAAVMAGKEDFKGTFEAMKQAHTENAEDPLIAFQLAMAADRYFRDKKAILGYYERYLNKFGTDSSYGEHATARASDLKKELFMSADN